MIHYTRGSKVVIEAVFKDSTGGVAFPTSVHLTVAYPAYTTDQPWPLNGTDLQPTSVISMTTPSTDAATSAASIYGVWRSTWNSAPSGTGIVYWTAVPTTEAVFTPGIAEGKFTLKGGLANPTAVPTTL